MTNRHNNRHVLKAEQFFDIVFLENYFKLVEICKDFLAIKELYRFKRISDPDCAKFLETVVNIGGGRGLFLWFDEESTRTKTSFALAADHIGMKRFGEGEVHFSSFDSVGREKVVFSSSSRAKDESFRHSVEVISGYPGIDAIVMRTPVNGRVEEAAKHSSVPIINAGDGSNEHPTQKLLDLWTVYRFFGKIDNLNIGLAGDLHYGRTVRSLAWMMPLFRDVTLSLIAHPLMQMKEDVLEHLRGHGVRFEIYEHLEDALPHLDVLYMTRPQKKRFEDEGKMEEYEQVSRSCRLTAENIHLLRRPKARVMHPMPISEEVREIDPNIENDRRMIFLPQAWDGVPARMAILIWVFFGFPKEIML